MLHGRLSEALCFIFSYTPEQHKTLVTFNSFKWLVQLIDFRHAITIDITCIILLFS